MTSASPAPGPGGRSPCRRIPGCLHNMMFLYISKSILCFQVSLHVHNLIVVEGHNTWAALTRSRGCRRHHNRVNRGNCAARHLHGHLLHGHLLHGHRLPDGHRGPAHRLRLGDRGTVAGLSDWSSVSGLSDRDGRLRRRDGHGRRLLHDFHGGYRGHGRVRLLANRDG